VKKIAVITSGRQDYGILRSTCLRLRDDPRFELQLVVMGMHLAAGHGATVQQIERDGLPIARRLDTARALAGDEAAATVAEVAGALRALAAEGLLLVGDRSETAAAALAAALERVPIAHLHGGEETEGAIDNLLRHAITKLSHLHLVSHEEHSRRVAHMGEDPAAIHIVGAPGLDNLHREDLPSREQLTAYLKRPLSAPLVAVTYHPTTLGATPEREIAALIGAMRTVPASYVITLPNNDPGSQPIRDALLELAAADPRSVAVEALGEARYFSLLRAADAVLGNSSSAVIEAPVFQLPAVNVGDRQRGRLRGANLIDVPVDAQAIAGGLRRALDPAFRVGLAGTTSPYGDGRSAPRVVELLAAWQPPRPPRKPFFDPPRRNHA
jgi:UDP-N-acetylglucosamine 2-epimerase (non-hydrolysing)